MEALIVFISKHIGRGFASTVGEPSREMTIGDDHIDQRAEWGEKRSCVYDFRDLTLS